jgi:hypothetical protein
MNAHLLRAADRLLPNPAVVVLKRAGRRVRSGVAAALAAPHLRRAVRETSQAFAPFEPREGSRDEALRHIAIRAVPLRGYPSHDAGLFNALLVASAYAETLLRPATLQSYADVAVRTAAIRAFAEYAAGQGSSAAETLLAALAAHVPQDRSVLLAHAELLLDRARPREAEPLIRRALRINAVCQTAQRLLARAAGDDYDLSDKFCPMPFNELQGRCLRVHLFGVAALSDRQRGRGVVGGGSLEFRSCAGDPPLDP